MMNDSGLGMQSKKTNYENYSKAEILDKAFQFHSKGNISEAETFYQIFINRGFSDARVNSNLGQIYRDKGNLKEAEVSTRKAIELNPNFASAHSNLGVILNDLGKLKEAEVSTRKAIQLNPNYATAHANLGLILKEKGGLEEAEVSTRKAIQLNPKYATTHCDLGIILIDLGKLKEAEVSTRKAIQLNPNYATAHANLGVIFKILGKLKEAELEQRKAIAINPKLVTAHSNLGVILNDLGKLKEAEVSTRQAIQLDPKFAQAYYFLSTLQYSNENSIWKKQLFSNNILNYNSRKDQINIYFARANILHNEKNYKDSAKYLQLANNLKLNLKPSNSEDLIKNSKLLLSESNKNKVYEVNRNYPTSIFIVGIPRCGSTLVESIITMKSNVDDLGEINILEDSFLAHKKITQKLTLAELYWEKTNCKDELKSTTNKWLYNYQYAGIIALQIPNAKIIHCYRNPLDNILSIYRAHFVKGNDYSSSVVDCAKVYLDQEKVMAEYKKKFRAKIYDLNYDSLVLNPNQEIKSLISWLGWEWDDKYLSPHLNPRSVSTASNVQVRFPLNSKSLGGWKNYKDMLRPAMEIITKQDKYKYLKY